MGKLTDYIFTKFPIQLVQFKDDVRSLVNFGKFQFQVVIATTGPSFAGRSGEITFLHNGTDGRAYVYMGSSWNLAFTWTADGSADSITP